MAFELRGISLPHGADERCGGPHQSRTDDWLHVHPICNGAMWLDVWRDDVTVPRHERESGYTIMNRASSKFLGQGSKRNELRHGQM